ncbi:hypothetical protein GPALN_011653 [Globodera pallida]|nr:hypothetical protein GPALN_011653 [Globodera pallida]
MTTKNGFWLVHRRRQLTEKPPTLWQVDATISNGSMLYLANESFSTVAIQLLLRRQSFYYVFNLVSLVAVIGFHAPINATGRRESKFRLGVMTLLSLSVMLLMLVDEMKFALESIPGQRGSFSDVPLIGIYYMSLISVISVATCTSSIFVHLEKFAIRNPGFQSVPQWLRFLCAKQLFCCYVPTRLNFADFQQQNAQQIAAGNATLEEPPAVMLNSSSTAALLHSAAGGVGSNSTSGLEAQRLDSKLDLLIVLLRELLEARRELRSRGQLPMYWERVIRRLEQCSLCIYLGILALNILGHDSFVCVCSAEYCDSPDPPGDVSGHKMVYYVSDKLAHRLAKFENAENDDANRQNANNEFEVRVDASQKRQTIFGFGGAFTDAAGVNLNALSGRTRDALLKAYFDQKIGIGYTVGRVPIASCDFSTREYSYLDTPDDFNMTTFALANEDFEEKIPYILKAGQLVGKDRLRLFASPWSPPGWMKTNEQMSKDGQLKGTVDGPYYRLYAQYLKRFFEEYAKQNVTFWGLTIQNEPCNFK